MALLPTIGMLTDNCGMMSNQAAIRFGEVVDASLERLVGQCHQLYSAPTLGSLIRTSTSKLEHSIVIYAVVAGVATSSLDPSRRVIARGANSETESDIHREYPQIETLMRTDTVLSVVGHSINNTSYQYLPPTPPRIHSFLYACSPEEVRNFTTSLDFLAILAGSETPSKDDVIAASIRRAAMAYDEPEQFLERAARSLASLLGRDTVHLSAILRRLPLQRA
jgi:hypothetical protein